MRLSYYPTERNEKKSEQLSVSALQGDPGSTFFIHSKTFWAHALRGYYRQKFAKNSWDFYEKRALLGLVK